MTAASDEGASTGRKSACPKCGKFDCDPDGIGHYRD